MLIARLLQITLKSGSSAHKPSFLPVSICVLMCARAKPILLWLARRKVSASEAFARAHIRTNHGIKKKKKDNFHVLFL